MSEPPLLRARILNGALAGREIELAEGELSIGGPESDLAVALEGGVEATVLFEADGARLKEPLPCWVDGKRVENGALLPFGAALDIAGCAIAFGTNETPLAHLAPVARATKRGMRTAAAGISLTLLTVLLAVAAFGTSRHQTQVEARAIRDTQLEQITADLAKAGVHARADSRGVLDLSGQCLSSAEVERARSRLRALHVPFHDNLVCNDDLLATVRATLAFNGYTDAKVEPGHTPGTVEIVGNVAGDARWEKTAKALTALRGLVSWNVRDAGAEGGRELIGRLREADLLGRLSVTRSNDVLLVTGLLDAAGRAKLDTLKAAFAEAHPAGPRVVYQNISSATLQAGLLPAPVVSVGGYGGKTRLELANGSQLEVGARLPNGYEIVGLDAHGIDLMKRDELIHLSLPI